jgi:hypothetical protein
MAYQNINIGVEGNDGTGDSIRDAFRKANENFTELYAVFGQGGQIAFTSLSDTPDSLGIRKVPVSNDTGTELEMRSLAGGIGIAVSYATAGQITITNTGSQLVNDITPELGGPLNANGYGVGNADVSAQAVSDFNATHGTNITIDELLITKGYADQRYLKLGGGSSGTAGQIRVRDEPVDATEYTITISSYSAGNAVITSHGFDTSANGIAYIYNSTGVAATGLTNGVTYYLRYVNDNQMSFHPSFAEATNDNDGTRIKITVSGGTGTQTIKDAAYDDTLAGYFLSTEAMPRKSIVRRQGDTMTGALYLNDHPGDLAGLGAPNGADDLQAATKFYVDNTSYSSPTNLFVSTLGNDNMDGVPPDKVGSSFSYAYKTINAACRKAEEIMISTPVELGPYVQTITYNSGAGDSLVVTEGVTSGSGYNNVKLLIDANRTFIIKQMIGFVNATYPNFTYNELICERDLGYILDGIVIDVLADLNSNVRSIQAGIRYYSNVSAAKAINQQLTETLAGINYAKSITNTILQNLAVAPIYDNDYAQTFNIPSTVNPTGRSSVGAKFDIITGIIQNGPTSAPPEVEGSTYTLTISNGSFGSVDQNDPNNQDLIPGKVIRGKQSGAIGRIVNITAGGAADTVEVILLEPKEFDVGEGLEFASPFKRNNITIRVESGTYSEDYPIRVPAGVSIKGDEFRRVIIRPKNRVSQSPWADTYFYRDLTIDGLTVTTTNFGYHYLEDATQVQNTGPTYVNAGGYNSSAEEILDAKPAIQTAVVTYINSLLSPSSLNATDEAKSRRDTGYIVDAIYNDLVNGGRENILEIQGSFFGVTLSAECKQGITYVATYINASVIPTASVTIKNIVTAMITSVSYAFNPAYNPPKNNREMDVFMMGEATILRNLSCQGHGGFMCVLDPDSQVLNKSPYIQTAASFSASTNAQAFRGGMFVDGSCGNLPMNIDIGNSAGPFELAVYSDPGEGLFIRKPQTTTAFYIAGARFQVDAIKDYDGPAGTATLLLNASSNAGLGFTITSPDPYAITLQTAGNRSLLSNDFTQVNDLGYGLLATNGALSEQVSMFTYYCHTAYMALNGAQIRSLNGSNANGVYGLVAQGSDPLEVPDDVDLVRNMAQVAKVYDDGGTYDHPLLALSIYVYDLEYIPHNRSEIEIDHDPLDSSVTLGVQRYEVASVELVSPPITVTGPSVTRNGTVYKLNLSTAGTDNASTTGLKAVLSNQQNVTIRASQSHQFSNVANVSPTRPSTALVFYDDTTDVVYRTTAFNTTNAVGTALPSNNVIASFDTAFDSVRLQIRPASAVLTTYAGTGTTMGATAGDVVLAIEIITEAVDITRLNTGNMSFGWAGKTHRVTGYVDRGTYATVSIVDISNINTSGPAAGIQETLVRGAGTENIVLRCGLLAGANADITVKISTCRATGHDFLDIGTGSFNNSNYPNNIFGDPTALPAQENEVDERGKGRVFYVSTDQDGVFRVGRFFTVDQGTGSVTFSASIALSNLDGLGFKRGVVASEFSTDSAMTDNASDTIPTESAVRGYVDRRLHYTQGSSLVGDPIGPGAIARDGTTSFTADISAGGFKLITLGAPTTSQDAANKAYVDNTLYDSDQIEDLRNVDIAGFAANQILVFNGRKRIFTTPETGGLFAVGNTITGSSTGSVATIVDYESVVLPGTLNARRITYSLVSGPDFSTLDSVSTGGGVSAQVIDGPMNELANGVMSGSTDISITATRTTAQTDLNLQIVAGSIINADVNSAAAIQQSKLAMNAATTRVNATGISQSDLGLASFDSSTFTITNGWVQIDSGDLAISKIENIATDTVIGRSAAGTGAPSAIAFSTVINEGGGLEDGDFATELSAALDPGLALIKTGATSYAHSNVSTTAEVNSIVKSDAAGAVDVASLKVDGSLLIDSNTGTNTSLFYTRGSINFLQAVGNTTANTTLTFTGRNFNFGGSSVPNSPTADALQSLSANTGRGIATPHLFTKFIETDSVETGGTGIALGTGGGSFAGAGKISIVLAGAVPFIFAGDADDSTITTPGVYPDADAAYTIGNASARYKTIFSEVFHGTATKALYADLAEKYRSDDSYESGTVLQFGGDKEVTIAAEANTNKIAGVVTTAPAFLMNDELNEPNTVAVALQGRVPCKVIGKISKGDMLVASYMPGVACAAEGEIKTGTVIGKSLEHYDSDQVGVIEIAIGR